MSSPPARHYARLENRHRSLPSCPSKRHRAFPAVTTSQHLQLQRSTLSRNSSPNKPRGRRYAIRPYVAHLETATLALSTFEFEIADQSPPCLVRSTSKFRQSPAITADFYSIHHLETALRVVTIVAAAGRRSTSLLSVALGPRRRHTPVFTQVQPLRKFTTSRQSTIRLSLRQLAACRNRARLSVQQLHVQWLSLFIGTLSDAAAQRSEPAAWIATLTIAETLLSIHLDTGAQQRAQRSHPSLSPHPSPSPTNLHPSRCLWWTAHQTHRRRHPSLLLPQPASLHPLPHPSPRRTFYSWSPHHRRPRSDPPSRQTSTACPWYTCNAFPPPSSAATRFPTRLTQSNATARFPTRLAQSSATARHSSQHTHHAIPSRCPPRPGRHVQPAAAPQPAARLLSYGPNRDYRRRRRRRSPATASYHVFAALPDYCQTLTHEQTHTDIHSLFSPSL